MTSNNNSFSLNQSSFIPINGFSENPFHNQNSFKDSLHFESQSSSFILYPNDEKAHSNDNGSDTNWDNFLSLSRETSIKLPQTEEYLLNNFSNMPTNIAHIKTPYPIQINGHDVRAYEPTPVPIYSKEASTIIIKPTNDTSQNNFNIEPTNAFIRTFTKIVDHYLNSGKCTLLSTEIIKTSRQKEVIKESDLVIEQESESDHPKKLSLSLFNKKKNTSQNTKKHSRVKLSLILAQKEETKKNQGSRKSLNKMLNKVSTKSINKQNPSKDFLSASPGKNFPKIFGRAVIRFIKEDLFSNKAAMRSIYEDSGLLENESMGRFIEWINSIAEEYGKLSIFRKVWLQDYEKDCEKQYSKALTEFTRMFLYQECYYYLIKNSGKDKRFQNCLVVEEYLKCIPVFIQGVNHPKGFQGLKSRI